MYVQSQVDCPWEHHCDNLAWIVACLLQTALPTPSPSHGFCADGAALSEESSAVLQLLARQAEDLRASQQRVMQLENENVQLHARVSGAGSPAGWGVHSWDAVHLVLLHTLVCLHLTGAARRLPLTSACPLCASLQRWSVPTRRSRPPCSAALRRASACGCSSSAWAGSRRWGRWGPWARAAQSSQTTPAQVCVSLSSCLGRRRWGWRTRSTCVCVWGGGMGR